jgi:hypothetical protein
MMGGRRTTASELRAKAKQPNEQAQTTADAMERPGYVLQAMEFDAQADMMDRNKPNTEK